MYHAQAAAALQLSVQAPAQHKGMDRGDADLRHPLDRAIPTVLPADGARHTRATPVLDHGRSERRLNASDSPAGGPQGASAHTVTCTTPAS